MGSKAELVQVVRLLSQQTEGISRAMLDALLQRLRGPIQLPECLRVVGYLRRLAPFPETVRRCLLLVCGDLPPVTPWHSPE